MPLYLFSLSRFSSLHAEFKIEYPHPSWSIKSPNQLLWQDESHCVSSMVSFLIEYVSTCFQENWNSTAFFIKRPYQNIFPRLIKKFLPILSISIWTFFHSKPDMRYCRNPQPSHNNNSNWTNLQRKEDEAEPAPPLHHHNITMMTTKRVPKNTRKEHPHRLKPSGVQKNYFCPFLSVILEGCHIGYSRISIVFHTLKSYKKKRSNKLDFQLQQ